MTRLTGFLSLFLLATAPAAFGQAQQTQVTIGGRSWPSWQAYTSSNVFRNGLRCLTPKFDPTRAGTFQAVPSDCAYGSTNPTSEYAPTTTTYSIPVVVHVIQSTSGQGFVSQQQAQNQIDILNEDFSAIAGTNGANGNDAKITFHLAMTDPGGASTTGVTYSMNDQWFNDGGNYWSSLAWNPNQYLNIYTNQAGGALGYVPDIPQGGIVGQNSDRVVVLWSSFGLNGPIGAPFDLGRTTTHEVGHYLGLYHTFDGGCGSASSCYTTGDRICDTNQEASDHMGCSPSASSCGSSDPIHNYMDYSDDICMWEFSPEQIRRMRCTLDHWRPQLATVTTGGPSTCLDPDALEPNDTCSAAGVLFAGTQNGLTVQKTDSDWYRIDVGASQTLTVNLSFSHAAGDVNLQILDACGGNVLANAQSSTDGELAVVANSGGSTQTYRVRVLVAASSSQDCNDYSMTSSLSGGGPTGCTGADSLEPNDSCGQAAVRGAGTDSNLTVQKTDSDWYRFDVAAGQTLTVQSLFSNGSGDLDLALYGTCGGASLDLSESVTDNEQVTVTNNGGASTSYFVECYVWNGAAQDCNDYDMVITLTGGGGGGTCSGPDDLFEPNDICSQGTPRSGGTDLGLFVSKMDQDWYRITVPAGATFDASILHDYANGGDLDLMLFAACGGTLLDSSETTNDLEAVSATNGGATQDWFLNVFVWQGDAFDCNDYSLTVAVSGGQPVNFASRCSGDGGDQMGCTDCPCNNDAPAGTIGGCLNSAGSSARLSASGDPSVSLPSGATTDLRFSLSSAPANAFCILNSGDSLAPNNAANPCFGLGSGAQSMFFDGLRCAVGNTRRHGGRSADAAGSVGVTNNPWGGEGGPPAGIAVAGGGFAAGQTRFFQVVNRDNPLLSCMRGLNTSQAVEVTFQP